MKREIFTQERKNKIFNTQEFGSCCVDTHLTLTNVDITDRLA